MSPEAVKLAGLLTTSLTNIAGMWFLVWYEVNRKWHKDDLEQTRVVGIFLRYRVAIIIGSILIPDWPTWFQAWLGA